MAEERPRVTVNDLKNPDDLCTCECGNVHHWRYSTSNDEGQDNCPECQLSWMQDRMNDLKELLAELYDPSMTEDQVNQRIAEKMAESIGIDAKTFVDFGYGEYYFIKKESDEE